MTEKAAKKAEKAVPKEAAEENAKELFLAAILIRGLCHVDYKIKDTLQMLNLKNKYRCIIVKDVPVYQGMLKKCKDYITWGEIDPSLLAELREKKERVSIIKGKKKVVPFFRLKPPKGGFERKGVKLSFKNKGALGYRGNAINALIRRMI